MYNRSELAQQSEFNETDSDFFTISNHHCPESFQWQALRNLLRPAIKLDLVIGINRLNGQFDIRESAILEVSEHYLLVKQTKPALSNSHTGQFIETTAVFHGHQQGRAIRWGWPSRVMSLQDDYCLILNENPVIGPTPAIQLSRPAMSCLKKVNLRRSYRLESSLFNAVSVELPDLKDEVRLVNFSAGGFMISSESPPSFSMGQEVPFKMVFPETCDYSESVIHGLALARRQEYECYCQKSKIGFKYLRLPSGSYRTMGKIMNYYMLEEQRQRVRIDENLF